MIQFSSHYLFCTGDSIRSCRRYKKGQNRNPSSSYLQLWGLGNTHLTNMGLWVSLVSAHQHCSWHIVSHGIPIPALGSVCLYPALIVVIPSLVTLLLPVLWGSTLPKSPNTAALLYGFHLEEWTPSSLLVPLQRLITKT